jgi:hypothetical protein
MGRDAEQLEVGVREVVQVVAANLLAVHKTQGCVGERRPPLLLLSHSPGLGCHLCTPTTDATPPGGDGGS